MNYRFSEEIKSSSMTDIDSIFAKLSQYSKMQETVVTEQEEASFIEWLNPIIEQLERGKSELEAQRAELKENSESLKRSKKRGAIFKILFAVLCVFVSACICFCAITAYKEYADGIVAENTEELERFKQNFLHVEQIDNQYITAINGYIDVSEISFKTVADAISFSAKLSINNDVYGVAMTKDTKYIVMTKSGMVFEYDMFGEHLKYSRISNMLGRGIREYGQLAAIEFYGIENMNDIAYIKINNMELFKLDIGRTVIAERLELELYCN